MGLRYVARWPLEGRAWAQGSNSEGNKSLSAQLNEWICGALGRLVAAFVKLACMTPFCVVWLSPTASVPPEPLHVVHCA